MGRFKQYLGKTEIEVDGEKLELDVTLEDKEKFLSTGKGEMNEERIKKITSTLFDIFKKSYPDEPEEELKAFVGKKIEKILVAVAIAFGWTTQEEMDRELKNSTGQ